jgi:hypothetical protein
MINEEYQYEIILNRHSLCASKNGIEAYADRPPFLNSLNYKQYLEYCSIRLSISALENRVGCDGVRAIVIILPYTLFYFPRSH